MIVIQKPNTDMMNPIERTSNNSKNLVDDTIFCFDGISRVSLHHKINERPSMALGLNGTLYGVIRYINQFKPKTEQDVETLIKQYHFNLKLRRDDLHQSALHLLYESESS